MKVLVADDDTTLRKLMGELLRMDGNHEVIETADGAEAWHALDTGPAVELCIFDVRMPKLGGLDLVRRVRADARFKRLKVILCSTIGERSTIATAATLGISSYLLKPFLAEDFLDRVRRVSEKAPPRAASQLEPFEPLDVVLKRLGVGAHLYHELVGIFTRDVASLALSLQAAPYNASPEIQMKLTAVEGAGRSLGATALVELIVSLEQAINRGATSAVSSIIPLIQKENEKAILAAARISEHSAGETAHFTPTPAPETDAAAAPPV